MEWSRGPSRAHLEAAIVGRRLNRNRFGLRLVTRAAEGQSCLLARGAAAPTPARSSTNRRRKIRQAATATWVDRLLPPGVANAGAGTAFAMDAPRLGGEPVPDSCHSR